MGIAIRYLVLAAAGTAFAASVERHRDRLFFDFDRSAYRAHLPRWQDRSFPGAATPEHK